MELHQLRYFVAAAETRNMTRAAARCRVAQPSLSLQIKKLEETLGVTLFDRLTRGLALTDAGRALLPRARRILAEVADAQAQLPEDVRSGAGSLAVGAIPTMAPYLLPAALGRVRELLPGCQITVREEVTERLLDAVANCEIDCAVLSSPIEHDQVELRILGAEPLLVALPEDHPAANQQTMGMAQLREEPTVSLDDLHCLGRQIASFCALNRVGSNIACRTSQLSTILELVRAGLGLSLIPKMATAAAPPGVRFVPVREKAAWREIALATRRQRAISLATEHLAAAVKAQLA